MAVEFLAFPVLFLLSVCRHSSCCVTRPPAAITQSLRYSEELRVCETFLPPSDLNAQLSTKRGNCCCSGSQLEPHLLFAPTHRVNRYHKYKYCRTCCHSDAFTVTPFVFCSFLSASFAASLHNDVQKCDCSEFRQDGRASDMTSGEFCLQANSSSRAEIEAVTVSHKRLSVFSLCLCESVLMQFFKILQLKVELCMQVILCVNTERWR